MKRMQAGAIGAALLLALALPAPAAMASTPTAAPSGQAASPSNAIASGVVTRGGVPVANAVVRISQWPSQAELEQLKQGDVVKMHPLGAVRTDQNGVFSINPGLAAKLDGPANLDLDVWADGKALNYTFAVEPTAHATTAPGRVKSRAPWSRMGTGNADPTPSFRVDMANGAIQPENSTVSSAAVASDSTAAVEYAAVANVVSPQVTCTTSVTGTYYNISEHFATTYTNSSSIPETVTESASSTHTLGVGVNFGSGWGASGSASISRSSTTSASSSYGTSHTIYNGVNYRDYYYSCQIETKRMPLSFYDILPAIGSNVGIVWQYNCAPHSAGDNWSTSSASNTTYGGGVSTPNISLNAQAGYGSSVSLSYHFGVAGEVCGNSTSGPASSSVVEADTF